METVKYGATGAVCARASRVGGDLDSVVNCRRGARWMMKPLRQLLRITARQIAELQHFI